MLDVFLTVILPTILVAAVGAVLQRVRGVSVGPLNQVTLYLLSPALVFRFMLDAQAPADVSLRVGGAALVLSIAFISAAGLTSLAMRHDRPMQSAFILATSFPNIGNMGLPIALLAFGEPGLEIAILVFIVQAVTTWTLGVYVAARSSGGGLAPLKQTLKTPIIYALAAAMVLRALDLSLPTTIDTPVGLMADAAIPVMLLVLGFQLGQGVDLRQWPSLSAALVLRLIAGVGIAYLVTVALGLEGVAQQVVILGGGMPAAVFVTILATEFNAVPRFVTSAVIAGTIVSLGTLTVLITVLQTWLG